MVRWKDLRLKVHERYDFRRIFGTGEDAACDVNTFGLEQTLQSMKLP